MTTEKSIGDSPDGARAPEQIATLIEEIGDYLTERTLDVRKRHVQARAGEARQPADKRVANLRYSLDPDYGKARPWHMLLSVKLTDIQDGAPIDAVTEPLKLAIRYLEQYAKEVRESKDTIDGPTLLVPMLRETKAQQALDLAQVELNDDPNNTEKQDRVLELTATYRARLNDYEEAVRARRAARERGV